MALNTQTAFTQENLNALEQAIVEGIKVVKYSDKEVEYRSLEDMLKIRNLMKKELCVDKSSASKGLFGGRRINGIHNKGLC